jgi:hypothetical protein
VGLILQQVARISDLPEGPTEAPANRIRREGEREREKEREREVMCENIIA